MILYVIGISYLIEHWNPQTCSKNFSLDLLFFLLWLIMQTIISIVLSIDLVWEI